MTAAAEQRQPTGVYLLIKAALAFAVHTSDVHAAVLLPPNCEIKSLQKKNAH